MLPLYNIADLLLAVTWALLRVSGMVLIAPIFGAVFAPMRVRVMIAVVIAVAMLPVIPELPQVSPLSVGGFLAIGRELLIGVAIGFMLKLVVEAATFAGQVVSTGMGLSFAVVVDPQAGNTPLLGRLYIITATLLLLAANAHLALIAAVAESYTLLPIGQSGLAASSALDLVRFGSVIFTGAMHLAMPAVIAILMVNVAFGVISRAAPTLNLFAVGFPVTLMLGFIVLTLSVRSQDVVWANLFEKALSQTALLLTGG